MEELFNTYKAYVPDNSTQEYIVMILISILGILLLYFALHVFIEVKDYEKPKHKNPYLFSELQNKYTGKLIHIKDLSECDVRSDNCKVEILSGLPSIARVQTFYGYTAVLNSQKEEEPSSLTLQVLYRHRKTYTWQTATIISPVDNIGIV